MKISSSMDLSKRRRKIGAEQPFIKGNNAFFWSNVAIMVMSFTIVVFAVMNCFRANISCQNEVALGRKYDVDADASTCTIEALAKDGKDNYGPGIAAAEVLLSGTPNATYATGTLKLWGSADYERTTDTEEVYKTWRCNPAVFTATSPYDQRKVVEDRLTKGQVLLEVLDGAQRSGTFELSVTLAIFASLQFLTELLAWSIYRTEDNRTATLKNLPHWLLAMVNSLSTLLVYVSLSVLVCRASYFNENTLPFGASQAWQAAGCVWPAEGDDAYVSGWLADESFVPIEDQPTPQNLSVSTPMLYVSGVAALVHFFARKMVGQSLFSKTREADI